MKPPEGVEVYELAPVDRELLIEEDAAGAVAGVPERVAFSLQAGISAASCGTVETVPGGGEVWMLRVRSEGALFLGLVFSGFRPREGTSLYVRDSAGDFTAGPFTSEHVNGDGYLGTPVVPGDETVIEIHSAEAGGREGIVLEEVAHGYKAFWRGFASGACEVDINCPEGAGWQDEKRAVAHIYFGGYICTGTLLNDVPRDCRNYFLTANHCISKAQKASICVFYWNHENASCGSGTGNLTQNQTGSQLRATDNYSDFTLLELNSAPSPAFNVYYAGWTNSASAPAGGTCIHHPDGDPKKISVESHQLVQGSYGSGFWRTPSWDLGATEGGSSGSGLWDPSRRIVGQLYGGNSYCGAPPADMWDEYGKFSTSWNFGSTADARLRDWLDPANTGAVYVDGRDNTLCGCSDPSMPVITGITDNSPNANTGITITFMSGSPATRHDLYREGVLVISGFVSGSTYSGGACDTPYNFTVSAVNGACSTMSAGFEGIDECAAVAPPGEVATGTDWTWTAAQASQSINWTADGDATGYRVYRGLRSELPALLDAASDFCTKADQAGTILDVTSDDPQAQPGRCYYYLISAWNAGGEGPAGDASAGPRIVNTYGSCLP